MGNFTNRINRLRVISITLDETKDTLISLIREGVNELHNGHHYLSDDSETFYEYPYEDDNEWKVTQIKVLDDDVVFAHSEPADDYDWHYLRNLCFDDLVYVAGFYT